ILVLCMDRPPPRYTLFPYTTLFRSWGYWDTDPSKQTNPLDATEESTYTGLGVERWLSAQRTTEDLASLSGIYTYSNSGAASSYRSEEHTSELQSRENLVCRLLLEKK